jgi:urease accessory protein
MATGMIRATSVDPAGSWPAADARDAVLLDYDARHRRRIAMRGEGGLDFLLDLPEALLLQDGDGLRLEDGGLVAVKAAPEPLIEVRAGGGASLLALAWHLGNRHLPTQVMADALRIREDHVIRDMLAKLGARLEAVEAPFTPEGGAYGGHHSHD